MGSTGDDPRSRMGYEGLAFEGAGGACGEFDGVFGAGFFGVLFEG
jgi:hypothetical protein